MTELKTLLKNLDKRFKEVVRHPKIMPSYSLPDTRMELYLLLEAIVKELELLVSQEEERCQKNM